jgi:hypothetical protein
MRKSFIITILVFLSISMSQFNISGQDQNDSIKNFKNTIRINVTNPMLFSDKYTVIGYERVIKENQSFSVNMGRFALPKFISLDLDSALQSGKSYKDKGFTIATDYRFYLSKENKYPAPRGVYIGPYYTYNFFERENNWKLSTVGIPVDVNTTIRLNMNTVGFQLGYQFVIKNRFAIDLILFGPGVWFYNVKTKLNTDLTAEEEELLFQKINEFLDSKIPGNNILLAPEELVRKGSVRTSSSGFRYVVHLGFRF